jgi:hypothetical protein
MDMPQHQCGAIWKPITVLIQRRLSIGFGTVAYAEDAHRASLERKKHAVLSDAKPECVGEFPAQRLDIA